MKANENRALGTVTLVGSGETSPSMGKVHRAVMSRIAGPVQPIFLDTTGTTGWIDWHEFLQGADESASKDAGEDEVEGEMESAEPFIDFVVQMRARLRADEQGELADEIRDRLAELGVILEDGPTETTWRREGP
jgi:cysteinyl-tRNA synthetase